MPELPEVETIKLQLAKFLNGHTIKNVILHAPRIFEGNTKDIIGGKVIGVRRFAKVLSIDLDNGKSIVSHIKLTGQFIYKGENLKDPKPMSKKVVGGAPGKHTRITFELDKKSNLYYNDIRMFGWVKIVESGKLEVDNKFIAKLGPEPFKDLTLPIFKTILSKTKRQIKIVLMDQAKMGGVGNIYANDALWLSKIHPEIPANTLSDGETKELYDAIHTVLKKGLDAGGASELAFVTPDGQEGGYQNYTLAYGMQGKVCPRCKRAKFEKYFLGGRGTYICSICQKK